MSVMSVNDEMGRAINMRNSIFLMMLGQFLALSASATGFNHFFEIENFDKICPDAEVYKYVQEVHCLGASSYYVVKSAKLGDEVKFPRTVAQKTFGAVELGVLPDDCTDGMYLYRRELLDSYGGRVGYVEIAGYRNSEMEVKIQLTLRYNLKGDLVSGKVKEL
jgi:uncharacterized membrane protein